MKVIPALLLLAFLAWSGLAYAASPDWNIVDHILLEKVVIQSHRGAGVLAEENTVAAFELGWKLGTYPECDLRTTTDGVIVTFHDENFSRVVKGVSPELAKKGVKDLTYEELMKLDVGAWKGDAFVGRRVSRLSDAFAAMRGRPERHLYLDIKNVDFKQLAAEVRAAGAERQIVLASPKPDQIREWKTLVPESDTLLWMRGSEADLRKRIDALRKDGFTGITQLQIHIFPNKTIEEALKIAAITPDKIKTTVESAKSSANRFTLSDDFIIELGRELRKHNILFQSLPYTSDTSVYAQLLDLGLASFATDYPDVTMREIKAYYDRKRGEKSVP
ncbi:MAG TPA: glycerophosphodiester phosphodiesterase family protein [Verrucomicrobiaceae bacterium]|jgi:glycerophosphoryl diester phosphodiesterase